MFVRKNICKSFIIQTCVPHKTSTYLNFVNIFHISSQFNWVMYISKSSFSLTLTISKQSSLIFDWVKHYLSNWRKYPPHHYTITDLLILVRLDTSFHVLQSEPFEVCVSEFLALYNNPLPDFKTPPSKTFPRCTPW